MRAAILLFILGISVPASFISPYWGVLMWYWVSYFNPHRFMWGFAYDLPVALLVAVPTLLGVCFARISLRSLLVPESLLLIGLWVWYSVTYIYAKIVPLFFFFKQKTAYEMAHISKILLMTLVMIVVITTRERLYGVMLVTGGSLGLLALKGAIFGARTAGASRIFGPPDSFLADNNAFALAVNVCLPILFFLARSERRRWLRMLLYMCFISGIVTVLLTYSRGGLLGLAVVMGAIILRSRHKILAAFAATVALVIIVAFAPPAWMHRMGRFAEGDLDATANQRLVSWETALNFSHDFPITGGSFHALPDQSIFKRYQPRSLPYGLPSSGPHSIYFQLLADQGFIGLALFLLLVASCFLTLFRIRRRARSVPEANWIVDYTLMVEIALLGFMTSGAFLGFVYLDLVYQMVGTVGVLKILLRKELMALDSEKASEASPAGVLEEVASLV